MKYLLTIPTNNDFFFSFVKMKKYHIETLYFHKNATSPEDNLICLTQPRVGALG